MCRRTTPARVVVMAVSRQGPWVSLPSLFPPPVPAAHLFGPTTRSPSCCARRHIDQRIEQPTGGIERMATGRTRVFSTQRPLIGSPETAKARLAQHRPKVYLGVSVFR